MSETQAGILVLLAIPVLWALMWWGWRRRQRRQAGVPAPLPAPADPGEVLLEPREGVYVSTTTEGDWLDRVVAHGLGRRSACEVGVFADGVSVARDGEDVLWVPAGTLVRVRRERGMAGKYVDREGLVVLTWSLGEDAPGDADGGGTGGGLPVDTGLRLRRDDDADALVAALAGLLARRDAPPGPPGPADGTHEDGREQGEQRA
ncbi:hypothetical protein [Pseudokineococcus lusitanus]|uniref:PH domain-containing protein n=1 Tax=Pseudokineococcus lusitanus TaxID=763993 RepID=A0A3N1G9C3_9ACTN|nr:hypothetical protein [Pseudokineococcus lusitanus]ROP26811.1 hypothetical protein EDC03_3048 [Pseudokineococcus lusitanus]